MIFYHFGRYVLLLKMALKKPQKFRIYWDELLKEMVIIGVGSLGIIALISVFIGAVTAVQTAYHLKIGYIPKYMIGTFTRNSTIMELSPTVSSLILAGTVGSSVASQIGTMRVTEQIDALEIMGVNTPGYLVLPKIIAGVITIPMLVIIAAVLSITGGMVACSLSGLVSTYDFILGVKSSFDTFLITIFLIKSAVFAFIITSVSSYQGFYASGGAREVGFASTKAVIYSCILIVCADYIIAQVLL